MSVIAIALAFATLQLAGPFLNSENLKAYNLVVDSLKQESTSERVSLPSFYQFKFYPIPEILSDAFFGDMLVMGHTINGQVSTLVMCGVSFETEEAICNIDQAEVE